MSTWLYNVCINNTFSFYYCHFVRVELLVDQFRKTSQLYQHNVLLVPHGDDFRYKTASEWDSQTKNLKKLFKYINDRTDQYNIKVRTLWNWSTVLLFFSFFPFLFFSFFCSILNVFSRCNILNVLFAISNKIFFLFHFFSLMYNFSFFSHTCFFFHLIFCY